MARDLVKQQARTAVNNAIKLGHIQRQPCEVCGTTIDLEAHHDDYTKKLDVRWLCIKHHSEHHYLCNTDRRLYTAIRKAEVRAHKWNVRIDAATLKSNQRREKMEISERKRAQRKAERLANPPNQTPAQSFRLGEEHLGRLKALSQRQDLAQVEMLRILIDKEWSRVSDARRNRK